MDFLNKAMAQAAEMFRSMTAGARLTTGLLLAVIVVALAFLFRGQSGGADSFLMNGEAFPASQLPAMIAAFGDANLNDYQVDGNRIRVPRGQEAKYMAALAAKDALPSNPLAYLERGLDDNPLFSDRHQRELRARVKKQRVLSEVITAMPGVESATVMFDEEDGRGLLREKDKTASVTVKAEGTAPLSEGQMASIRRLVSSSFAGLKYEKVALTDVNARQTFCGDADSPASVADDAYRSRKRMDEREWQDKILRALSYVPGATVAVNVELDKEQSRHEKELKHDPKTIPIQTTEKTRTRAHEGSSPSGAAGFTANQPAALGAGRAPGAKEDEEETDRQEVNAVSGQVTEKVTVGMTPTRVSVSVGVPTGYFEQVWRERNPATDGQTKAPQPGELDQVRTQEVGKIRKAVAALLPAVVGATDPLESVTVTEFQNITTAPPAPPPTMQVVTQWLTEHWRTLGLMLLGLVSLLVFRSAVKSVAAREVPATTASASAIAAAPAKAAAEEEPEEESAEAAQQRRLKRLAGGGPSLKDELSQIVSEDPDAAANILRNWIGTAS